MDLFTGLIGDLPSDSPVSNAAAVHHGHIHIHAHAVKEVVEGVGGKVAGVGLLLAHQAAALGVIVVQGHLRIADDLSQLCIDFADPGILQGLHLRVGGQAGEILSGEELCGNGAVGGNGQLSHGIQIGAGLCEDDRISLWGGWCVSGRR